MDYRLSSLAGCCWFDLGHRSFVLRGNWSGALRPSQARWGRFLQRAKGQGTVDAVTIQVSLCCLGTLGHHGEYQAKSFSRRHITARLLPYIAHPPSHDHGLSNAAVVDKCRPCKAGCPNFGTAPAFAQPRYKSQSTLTPPNLLPP